VFCPLETKTELLLEIDPRVGQNTPCPPLCPHRMGKRAGEISHRFMQIRPLAFEHPTIPAKVWANHKLREF
jgi:hypothetical protein